jgi:hypothetical protein
MKTVILYKLNTSYIIYVNLSSIDLEKWDEEKGIIIPAIELL